MGLGGRGRKQQTREQLHGELYLVVARQAVEINTAGLGRGNCF